MEQDYKSVIIRHRAEMLRQLAALASEDRSKEDAEKFRVRALNFVKLIEQSEVAVNALPEVTSDYAGCSRPIDAIVQYLEQHRSPATREEITTAILKGGFRGGPGVVEGIEWRIGRSFDNFIVGTGRASNLIKEINGLVGRPDWEESLFRSPR